MGVAGQIAAVGRRIEGMCQNTAFAVEVGAVAVVAGNEADPDIGVG